LADETDDGPHHLISTLMFDHMTDTPHATNIKVGEEAQHLPHPLDLPGYVPVTRDPRSYSILGLSITRHDSLACPAQKLAESLILPLFINKGSYMIMT